MRLLILKTLYFWSVPFFKIFHNIQNIKAYHKKKVLPLEMFLAIPKVLNIFSTKRDFLIEKQLAN